MTQLGHPELAGVTTTFASMSKIVVEGGRSLAGTVNVLGAKNAVLKEMVSALLAPGRHRLTNVPSILDVELMCRVLEYTGCKVDQVDQELWIVVPEELRPESPIDLVRQMRASIVVLGPLLARCGIARVALPGGDDLGSRPIEWHMSGLEQMGVSFELVHGELVGRIDGKLKGAEIELPFPSVGATENVLFAGVLAEGETVIVNAAREPEIEDLIGQLAEMGADITGGGTSLVTIRGVEALHPIEHKVIPDRLEAGTFAVAAAITTGDVTITGCH
ncbi:MAG: UDP-N-acetylglucosamine 1-carboxyvinyltransferase, partial [Actinobacteria bacterium]|nr:UDP-N-acetylglucosamine 1-carboxyvinyltransferase [Actinomycetota bacterium]